MYGVADDSLHVTLLATGVALLLLLPPGLHPVPMQEETQRCLRGHPRRKPGSKEGLQMFASIHLQCQISH
ncbi:hypothetical protein CEXT_380211 [Caerostris extrusa]|uniref:Uncharacterized protein n=1 Tax=Caerostris extrusa TaxID=172846 RepID=A0AAV4XLG4_CAEEX|nr:hypothetical protein CEXT_380211 [Caerostris extrusa]